MRLCAQAAQKKKLCSILDRSTKKQEETHQWQGLSFLLTLACAHHQPLSVVLSTLKTCSALRAVPLPGPSICPDFCGFMSCLPRRQTWQICVVIWSKQTLDITCYLHKMTTKKMNTWQLLCPVLLVMEIVTYFHLFSISCGRWGAKKGN